MSTNAENLARWVLKRREELGMSQLEVWRTGGPSNTKLTEIENGRLEKLTPSTSRKLDGALLWEPGGAKRAWEGDEPIRLGRALDRRDERWLRDRIDEAEISAALRSRLLAAFEQRGMTG